MRYGCEEGSGGGYNRSEGVGGYRSRGGGKTWLVAVAVAVVVGLIEKKAGVKVSSSIAVPTSFASSDASAVIAKKSCVSGKKNAQKICVCRRKLVPLHQKSRGSVLISFFRFVRLSASGENRLSDDCVQTAYKRMLRD